MVATNMDLDSFFRNKVESMLITASWVEQVQKMLDLVGVSQVWGDRPEWYVWIDGAPGAYALVFEQSGTIATADQVLNVGQFVVKCYPYLTASVFEAPSLILWILILSWPLFFIRRKTPRLLPYFFSAGSSAFLWGPETAM